MTIAATCYTPDMSREGEVDNGGPYVISLVRHEDDVPGHSARVQADKQGRVLFREQVEPQKIEHGLEVCLRTAKAIIAKMSQLSEGFTIDRITLKLGLDAEVGCAFIADASLDASIEIEIKRLPSTSD